jgi:prevent-host-death family protein
MTTITVTVHEAKAQLLHLLAHAETGDEVVIAHNGKPVARLVPFEGSKPSRRFGAMRGQMTVDEHFFEPLPETELAAWE